MPDNTMLSSAERQEALRSGPDYETWTEVVGQIEEIKQLMGWSTNRIGRLMGYAGTGLWSVLKGRNVPEKKKIVRLRYMHRMVKEGKGEELIARPIGASAARSHYVPVPAGRRANTNFDRGKKQEPEPERKLVKTTHPPRNASNGGQTNNNRLDLAQQELNAAIRCMERMQMSLTKELEHSPRILKAGITLILNETETVKTQLNDIYRYFGE